MGAEPTMLLPLLLACGSNLIVGADSAAPRDSADSGDSGGGVEGELDLSRFEGERRFSYDASELGLYCDETVEESGEAIVQGTATWTALHEACERCTRFWAVVPRTTRACEWITLGANWRGLEGDDTSSVLHFWTAEGSTLISGGTADATWDGALVRFAYVVDIDPVDLSITGVFEFPRMDADAP